MRPRSSTMSRHVSPSAMTGLEVAGVNLRIEDVITPEEYEHRTSQHE